MIKYILLINEKEIVTCSDFNIVKIIFDSLYEKKDPLKIDKMEVMNSDTGGIEMYLDKDKRWE